MLTMIFEWLAQAMGEALELFVEIVLQALELDLSAYVTAFPALYTGYQIFQGVGVGLAAVLGIVGLIRFFQPNSDQRNGESPLHILGCTLISGVAIYMGNYVLELIVDIAKVPYGVFAAEDFVDLGGFSLTRLFSDVGTSLLTGGASALATTMLSFVVILLIAYNLLKLILEVFERYMMVGILAYVSPLFFALIPNSGTRDSFRRWFSMFVGSCAMMTVSAFFLKLVCSGFSGMSQSSGDFVVKLLLVLATCKIAQRVDTYMQQLGISVATTGQNMLDDFIVAGRSISNAVNSARRSAGGRSGAGRNRDNVLDGAASRSRFPGIAGGVVTGVKTGVNAFRSGNDLGEAVRKGAESVANTVKDTDPVYKGVKAAKTAASEGATAGESARAAMAAAAGQAGRNAAQFVAPRTMNAHEGAKQAKAAVEELQAKRRALGDDMREENTRYASVVGANAAGRMNGLQDINSREAHKREAAKASLDTELAGIESRRSADLAQVDQTRDADVAKAHETAGRSLSDMGIQMDSQTGQPVNVPDDQATAVGQIMGARDDAISQADERAQSARQSINGQYDDMRQLATANYDKEIAGIAGVAERERSEHASRWAMEDQMARDKHQENVGNIEQSMKATDRAIENYTSAYPGAFADSGESASGGPAPRDQDRPRGTDPFQTPSGPTPPRSGDGPKIGEPGYTGPTVFDDDPFGDDEPVPPKLRDLRPDPFVSEPVRTETRAVGPEIPRQSDNFTSEPIRTETRTPEPEPSRESSYRPAPFVSEPVRTEPARPEPRPIVQEPAQTQSYRPTADVPASSSGAPPIKRIDTSTEPTRSSEPPMRTRDKGSTQIPGSTDIFDDGDVLDPQRKGSAKKRRKRRR